MHEIGPEEIRDIPLITMEELRFIRQIWLDEKHEFDDALPRIYEEVTGKPYADGMISKNKYFGAAEAELLETVCKELYPEEQLYLRCSGPFWTPRQGGRHLQQAECHPAF